MADGGTASAWEAQSVANGASGCHQLVGEGVQGGDAEEGSAGAEPGFDSDGFVGRCQLKLGRIAADVVERPRCAAHAHETILQPSGVEERGVFVREMENLRAAVGRLQRVAEQDGGVVVGADIGIMAELLDIPWTTEVHGREFLRGPGDVASEEAVHELQPGRRTVRILNDPQDFVRRGEDVALQNCYEREGVNVQSACKAEEEFAILGNALPVHPAVHCCSAEALVGVRASRVPLIQEYADAAPLLDELSYKPAIQLNAHVAKSLKSRCRYGTKYSEGHGSWKDHRCTVRERTDGTVIPPNGMLGEDWSVVSGSYSERHVDPKDIGEMERLPAEEASQGVVHQGDDKPGESAAGSGKPEAVTANIVRKREHCNAHYTCDEKGDRSEPPIGPTRCSGAVRGRRRRIRWSRRCHALIVSNRTDFSI